MGETLGGDDKHSPPRMGCGMGETLMDRGGKGGRPLGRGKGNWRSPHGPHWQWERPRGMQGVGGETMGGDDKHSPLKIGCGMGETPGQWGTQWGRSLGGKGRSGGEGGCNGGDPGVGGGREREP